MSTFKFNFAIVCFLLFVNPVFFKSQTHQIKTKAIIIDGDTMPYIECAPVLVVFEKYKNSKHYEAWTRIKYNVKMAYSLAIIASSRLKEYDLNLSKIENNKDKSKYLSQVEKTLIAEFNQDLKKLSMQQGKILLKLIDRETGKSSYQILKEYRGSFQAFLWQGVARIFGHNMKSKYNLTTTEDIMIEEAIRVIEAGYF